MPARAQGQSEPALVTDDGRGVRVEAAQLEALDERTDGKMAVKITAAFE